MTAILDGIVTMGVYDQPDFSRLPILADALMDAGCDDEEIDDHYRNDACHVKECWVVKAILSPAQG